MKQLAIFLFLTYFITSSMVSQSYKDYNHFTKKEIFSEHFNDNENNWRQYYSKIKKGRYVVETIGKDPATTTSVPVAIDTNRNYEIETEISIEWNRTKEYMGIMWNANVKSGYFLAFNKDLITQVIEVKNNQPQEVTKAENLGALRPMYDKNLITVRRIDQEYLIFINRTLAYTVPYNGYHGNQVGYTVGQGSELRAYSLVVSYLE